MGKSARNGLSLPNSLHLFFCQLIQCTFALLWQSFSGAALWASYFVLNPPKNIHTHAPSHFYKEKNPPAWQLILPFSCLLLILHVSLHFHQALSHFHTHFFKKRGLFPLAVLFDNMGHWCCSHITHKHQSMYVLTDLLSDIDKACPEVQRKNLCQIQIRHRHTSTRMDEWSAQALDFVHRMLTYLTAESNLLSAHSQINTMQLRIQQSWSHQ